LFIVVLRGDIDSRSLDHLGMVFAEKLGQWDAVTLGQQFFGRSGVDR